MGSFVAGSPWPTLHRVEDAPEGKCGSCRYLYSDWYAGTDEKLRPTRALYHYFACPTHLGYWQLVARENLLPS